MTNNKENNFKKKYHEMSEQEKKQYNRDIKEKIRQERIAKRRPGSVINSLLNKEKNVVYEGVSIGGHLDSANNWYKENTYHLTDLSMQHGELGNGLSERIEEEIVKPINEYSFEKTGKEYPHENVPDYRGYTDVPNIYDSLFHYVCENLQIGIELDFEKFAEEQIEEHKRYIDE